MPGIPRELAEHVLEIDPDARLIKHSLRRFSEPNRKAISEEINRLLEAKFIREIKQATWVANPVLILKNNTKVLQMCVDRSEEHTSELQSLRRISYAVFCLKK